MISMKIAEMPVGTMIRDEKGLSFLIAEHQSPDYKGTVLVSERVIRMMPFDTPKEEYGDKECKKFGSNDFMSSDLCQWLNSEDGFLQDISMKLRDSITESEVPYAGMASETTSVKLKVFIPSIGELGLDIPDHLPEGQELALFREFRNRYAMPLKELADRRPPGFNVLDPDDTWCYWLRSAHPAHPSVQYISHSHSPYAFCEAYRDYVGVRVMFTVNDDLEITMDEKGGMI